MRKFLRKYKIKAKKLYTIIALSILEVILILWCNNWVPTPALLAPAIQFVLIFEYRDVWDKLSDKEKKELTLSEDELDKFVIGIEKEIKDGKSANDILIELKKD